MREERGEAADSESGDEVNLREERGRETDVQISEGERALSDGSARNPPSHRGGGTKRQPIPIHHRKSRKIQQIFNFLAFSDSPDFSSISLLSPHFLESLSSFPLPLPFWKKKASNPSNPRKPTNPNEFPILGSILGFLLGFQNPPLSPFPFRFHFRLSHCTFALPSRKKIRGGIRGGIRVKIPSPKSSPLTPFTSLQKLPSAHTRCQPKKFVIFSLTCLIFSKARFFS